MQFVFCHVNSGTGITEFLRVFPVCKPSIIFIFVCDGTVVDFLVTAIADVRSFIKSGAAFPLKIGQVRLQVVQEAHMIPQMRIFPQALVFLQ